MCAAGHLSDYYFGIGMCIHWYYKCANFKLDK